MKMITGLIVGLMGLSQVSLADHASLQRLAREMGLAGTNLYTNARPVLGPRPTYRQRYAFEHISFFHNSAHRFERVVGARLDMQDDHASDIRYAFRQLESDLYHARQTFLDLFYGERTDMTDDHPSLGNLERYLQYAESLIPQIQYNLP